jgi:hypothetical protein
MVRKCQHRQLVGMHLVIGAVKMKLWKPVSGRRAAGSTGGCYSYCMIDYLGRLGVYLSWEKC